MIKFDAIVGNPPYHYSRGRRKIPIYDEFIQ
jgi:tRNA1(Val) A37 N6-methylase TrmN6